MNDWKGMVIRRRYRLDERLAIGRTVEVFRAFDLLEEREVAVKIPLPHLVSDADFCDSFRSAAYRATRLRDPGVIQVLDYGMEEGRPFVVMEMVEQKSLRELLDAGKKMKPIGALYFAVEMGKILAYLHGQGVAHGSLDEGHVFVFPGRKAKVSDPGFPTVLGGGESPYPLTQNPRRDIQNLGYMLYRSLTGRSRSDAAEDVRKGKLKWSPEVPERLRRLVERCMESAGAGGFSSSEEMLREAVTAFREEQPMVPVPNVGAEEAAAEEPEAKQPRPVIPPLPRLKRWQMLAGAAVLAALLIWLAAFLFSTFISGKKVEVPNVVNMDIEEAANLARQRGLVLVPTGEDYHRDMKKDYVISQTPKGGEMVEEGTVIKVLKSLGPLQVPNLVGLSLQDARQALEGRGFRVGEIIYREVTGYSEGKVVETDPPYGFKLSGGDPVNLVVSKSSSGS